MSSDHLVPFFPTEMPGSGYHEPDIGPLHVYPLTLAQHESRERGRAMMREIGGIFAQVVVPALRFESPFGKTINPPRGDFDTL